MLAALFVLEALLQALLSYPVWLTYDCMRLQVPTTVMAAVDASVGIKTAVNFENRKNKMGTYCPPLAVYIDRCALEGCYGKAWLCVWFVFRRVCVQASLTLVGLCLA